MATDKYDLHTISYSVQGWDNIFSTDIEQLDDIIHSRILATLGETVAISDTLYLDTDGKYYKAQSDGTQQPAMGLSLETGVLNDSIRIQRIGPITDATWTWSVKGAPVFLSSSTAGGLTETEPTTNAQTIGRVLSATSIYIDIEFDTVHESILTLADTPAAYNDGKYLKSTATGVVFDDIVIKASDDSLWKITVTTSGILSTTSA